MRHELSILLSITVLLTSTCLVLGEAVAQDAFMGDWQGDKLVAQVIPRGGDRYEINMLPEFDARCDPLAVIEARSADGQLRFDHDGWTGEVQGVFSPARVLSKARPFRSS